MILPWFCHIYGCACLCCVLSAATLLLVIVCWRVGVLDVLLRSQTLAWPEISTGKARRFEFKKIGKAREEVAIFWQTLQIFEKEIMGFSRKFCLSGRKFFDNQDFLTIFRQLKIYSGFSATTLMQRRWQYRCLVHLVHLNSVTNNSLREIFLTALFNYTVSGKKSLQLSLIHIWRCRRRG